MIKYTDAYINILARGLCQPNEQIVAASAGEFQSFWTFKIPFFKRSYLLIASTDRLIVVQHRRGLLFDRLDSVESYAWSDIGMLKVSGFLKTKAVLRDPSNRVLLTMRTAPFFLQPLKKNDASLKAIAQLWAQQRALPMAPAYGALPGVATPPPQAYAPPAPSGFARSTFDLR